MIEPVRCAVLSLPDRPGVRFVGELDVSNREVLRRAIMKLANQPNDVYFDLAGLTFIDVGGISALVAFAREHRPHRVVVQRPSPLVRRILTMLWADSGLEIAEAESL